MENKIAVVAIGGNSLIKDKKNVTVESQYQAAKETTVHIADMIESGWTVAIGHGNGPQVGFILRRSEIAHKVEGMHEVPLDVCGSDSQGAIHTAATNQPRLSSAGAAASATISTIRTDDPVIAFSLRRRAAPGRPAP